MNSAENTTISSWPEAPGAISGRQSWMLFFEQGDQAAPTTAPSR